MGAVGDRQLRHFLRQRRHARRLQRPRRAGGSRPATRRGQQHRGPRPCGRRLHPAHQDQGRPGQRPVRPGPALVRARTQRHRVRRLRDELSQPQPEPELYPRDQHRQRGDGDSQRQLQRGLPRRCAPVWPELRHQRDGYFAGRRGELPAEHAVEPQRCRHQPGGRGQRRFAAVRQWPVRQCRGSQRRGLQAHAGAAGADERHPVFRPGSRFRAPDPGGRGGLQPHQRPGRKRR
ncbi:hypothetical protein D3C84_685110 [compost metagenome]